MSRLRMDDPLPPGWLRALGRNYIFHATSGLMIVHRHYRFEVRTSGRYSRSIGWAFSESAALRKASELVAEEIGEGAGDDS